MQVTETTTEGLKREFRVTVPATDLETRVNERLAEMKDKVRINGFRPGKVPVAHLKKVYGRSVMAETIEQMVRETSSQVVSDRGLKLAMDPKITLPDETDEIEGVINGKTDLSYTVAVEVVPQIELADFKAIKLEKLVADVGDEEVDAAVTQLAEQNRTYKPRPEGATAETGDRIVISFKGTIAGEAFEGGSGDDVPVVIGSGGFLPGFEDQLTGIAAGETRVVDVTFPADYAVQKLAGQAAAFEVMAKSVEVPDPIAIDDALAVSLGANPSTSCARRFATGLLRTTPRPAARSSNGCCSTSLTSCINSVRPRLWWNRNSPTCGMPCWPTLRPRIGPSRTKVRPRKRPARNTAASPTDGSGSDWCLRKSATRTTSR